MANHMNTRWLFETIWRDLRHALRVWRKSPGFTATALASLALGIGANTAVFSLVHAVMLRSLPYPDPGRLVMLGLPGVESVTLPEYQFWTGNSASFGATVGHQGVGEQALFFAGRLEWIQTRRATAGLFDTLRVNPALGRDFNADETRRGGALAVIISDGLWRRSFGADPAVIGRAVRIDDASYTVVGVLPRGFWFPDPADAFVALRPSGTVGDNGRNTYMIARLKPEAGIPQARAEMAALSERFRRTLPADEARKYAGLTVIPYQEWLVGDVRVSLWLLFGAVGLLLLIACSNLASLLMARLAARQKEIAVRLALGSGSSRLLRQFFTENMLLVVAGTLAGILCGYWLLSGLVALVPFKLPASAPIALDLPVLAFTGALALATGVVFGLVPFLTAGRLDLHEGLKAAGRGGGSVQVRQRTRRVLVVGEVALSVSLLVAAALLIQSLYLVQREQLGFSPHGLITFRTPPPPASLRKPEQTRIFESNLAERLRALPGVRSVASISQFPLTSQFNYPSEWIGHPDEAIGGMEIRIITPGYFEAMEIPVLRGRPIETRDAQSAQPVILVNETLARRWWHGGDPLGSQVKVGRFHGKDYSDDPPREVVGVVADTKTVYLKQPPRPTVYVAAAQAPWYSDGLAWVVRTNAATGLAESLRRTVAEVDPSQRVEGLRPVDQILASSTADSRFDAWLFGSFAGVALVLTAVGVYGMLAFSVSRRTNEIGVRIALGASRSDVLGLVLKEGCKLIVIGLAVGLAGALVLTRSLATLLFHVQASDPLSFAAVAVVLLGVGLLASYLPAQRATKVDPLAALRNE